MSRKTFLPTDEQKDVVRHPRSAFISACPGAWKTQVLIERARRELNTNRCVFRSMWAGDSIPVLHERCRWRAEEPVAIRRATSESCLPALRRNL